MSREHVEPVRIGDALGPLMHALAPDPTLSAAATIPVTTPTGRTGAAGGSPGPAGAATVRQLGGLFGGWVEAVGEVVAAHVQPLRIDGTTLVVEVDDPAWATQMRLLEGTLRDRLATVAGLRVERVDVRVAGRRAGR